MLLPVRIASARRSFFVHRAQPGFFGILALLLAACGGEDEKPEATQAPVCDPAARALGGITTPNPLVSVGAPTFASEGVTNAEKGTDGLYHQGDGVIFGRPTEDAPEHWAVELEPGPTRLLLTWASASFGDYDVADLSPGAYTIETSADSTDGSDGSWTEVVDVVDNLVRTRAHAFDFADQRWVRFTVKAPAALPATMSAVEIDEFALFDESEGSEDTWFFLGDSITAGAFIKNAGQLGNFEARITKERPAFTPAVIGGGIGGEQAKDALARLDEVLELNQDITYFGIGYGTNDSWGNWRLEQTNFESYMTELVDRVIAAGHVPVLARIPYSYTDHKTLPEFNAVIDRLTKAYGLPCGPDLYGYFKAHQDELNLDGVHPSGLGYQAMNGEWAKAVLPLYPEP